MVTPYIVTPYISHRPIRLSEGTGMSSVVEASHPDLCWRVVL